MRHRQTDTRSSRQGVRRPVRKAVPRDVFHPIDPSVLTASIAVYDNVCNLRICRQALPLGQAYRPMPCDRRVEDVPPGFMDGHRRRRVLFVCVCLTAVLCEGWALFLREMDQVRAKGTKPFSLEDFGEGVPVAQTFLMVENGLDAVSLQFLTDSSATIRVVCELTQLWDHTSGAHRVLHRWTSVLEGISGTEWQTIGFPPVPFSRNWLYKFQIRLLDASHPGTPVGSARAATTARRPRVSLMAFADNALADGSLFIAGREQLGDLSFAADGAGRTAYARFQLRAGPKLPVALGNPVVQFALLLLYNLALMTFAYSLLVVDHGVER